MWCLLLPCIRIVFGYVAQLKVWNAKTLYPMQSFNGKKWEKFNSEKVASLAYARIQGKAALIAHFQNSSLMNEDKRCRPILFHTDGPNAGDQVWSIIFHFSWFGFLSRIMLLVDCGLSCNVHYCVLSKKFSIINGIWSIIVSSIAVFFVCIRIDILYLSYYLLVFE